MDAPLSRNQLILDKYCVERVLGHGAMGVVVAARHRTLGDRVAIKLLLPELLSQPLAVERFLQEARAARKIKSEHVARVIDVDVLSTGAPCIIMEYLEGEDLASLRDARGTLDVPEAVDYILQACEAVAEAHSHGIIHRDLKPSNLFMTRRPDGSPLVKVLDFGTSKIRDGGGPRGPEMTTTGVAIGSPSYMAPEQWLSSRTVDARADVWSLGVILYNLLTRAFPFESATLAQLCAAVLQAPPRSPLEHRSDLDPDLAAVILTCLEKPLDKRFQNVAELSRALLRFAPPPARLSVERIERVYVYSDPSVEAIEIDDAPESQALLDTLFNPQSKRVESDAAVTLPASPASIRSFPSTLLAQPSAKVDRSDARSTSAGRRVAMWLAAASALSASGAILLFGSRIIPAPLLYPGAGASSNAPQPGVSSEGDRLSAAAGAPPLELATPTTSAEGAPAQSPVAAPVPQASSSPEVRGAPAVTAAPSAADSSRRVDHAPPSSSVPAGSPPRSKRRLTLPGDR